jgi:transcriptional regulator with XRE-family HTH domain
MDCWKTKKTDKIVPNGPSIRAERIRFGWSLRELADFMGISPSYLSKIETGKVSSISEETKRKFKLCGFEGR